MATGTGARKRGLLMTQRYASQSELARAIGISSQAVSMLDALLDSKLPIEPPPSAPAPAAL